MRLSVPLFRRGEGARSAYGIPDRVTIVAQMLLPTRSITIMYVEAALNCGRKGSWLGDFCASVEGHDPTGLVGPLLQHIVGPLLVFVAIYLGGRFLRRITVHALERAHTDAQVRTLVNNVVSVGTIVFAILTALTAAGLELSVLLTFGGLFSLAIGFAFQDILRNFLAGILLLLEHPFRIGDLITVGDQIGVVQTIHLRTTQLRTLDGRLAVLPNLTAFSNPVINSSAYPTRRYEVAVWIPVGSDLEAALRAAQRELSATAALTKTIPPMIIPKVDVDGGHMLLQCRFWLDYHHHDSDEVAADVARRVRVAVDATVEPGDLDPRPDTPD